MVAKLEERLTLGMRNDDACIDEAWRFVSILLDSQYQREFRLIAFLNSGNHTMTTVETWTMEESAPVVREYFISIDTRVSVLLKSV